MRTILVLVALAVLLGGCSSTQTAQAGAHDPAKMPKAGPALSTDWGVLPSYKQPTVLNLRVDPMSIFPWPPDGKILVIDVLVSGDGTVRDVALHRSCGYPEMDRAYLVAYRAARFPPMPTEYQSLVYVTRQTTILERVFPSRKDFLGDVRPAETPNLYRY